MVGRENQRFLPLRPAAAIRLLQCGQLLLVLGRSCLPLWASNLLVPPLLRLLVQVRHKFRSLDALGGLTQRQSCQFGSGQETGRRNSWLDHCRGRESGRRRTRPPCGIELSTLDNTPDWQARATPLVAVLAICRGHGVDRAFLFQVDVVAGRIVVLILETLLRYVWARARLGGAGEQLFGELSQEAASIFLGVPRKAQLSSNLHAVPVEVDVWSRPLGLCFRGLLPCLSVAFVSKSSDFLVRTRESTIALRSLRQDEIRVFGSALSVLLLSAALRPRLGVAILETLCRSLI